MIISTSNVSMTSAYAYSKTKRLQQISVDTSRGGTAIKLVDSNTDKKDQQKVKDKEITSRRNQERTANLLTDQNEKTKEVDEENDIKTKEELEYEALKKILGMFHNYQEGRIRPIDLTRMMDMDIELDASSNILDLTTFDSVEQYNNRLPSIWTRTTVSSSFETETENTAFTSTGTAMTADGRELSFGITVEMSRSFTAKYTSVSQMDYVFCDPLVINLTNTTAQVTDEKFLFDLDSDGKKEEISFAGEGSGFLALDKNHDGKINDGNELFGTKSGDGFKDLAAYDKDSNGWIDEADDVYKDLKVWVKDAEGKDQLMDLKKAGIGAIYLGSSNTKFSLNNADNETNAVIRKTGLYLHESGVAGTIQHLDLTV